MKMKLFFLLLLPMIVCLLSCAKDEPAPQVLEISEATLHFPGGGGAWRITVKSNSTWKISGTTSWCTVNKTEGANTEIVTITVDDNATAEERSAHLLVSGASSRELTIRQDTVIEDFHYELPVIFHIFYANEADSTQYIKSHIITKLIEQCNQKYSNSTNSVYMNLQLVAATEDTGGKPLAEPGIERIQRNNSVGMSCEEFMKGENTTNADLLWDLNKYVNVFVYQFKETNTLGIAHLPYTSSMNSLAGLTVSDYYFTHVPAYTHCISLNSSYINESDAATTLGHELGHYLGLFHVFVVEKCSEQGDYCEDTPSYNRAGYEAWLETLMPPFFMYELVKRTSCDNQPFISYNIMDYDFSYMDRFTPDQFLRVRHVLKTSPLIPGPKEIITTKGAVDNEIPPVRFMP